MKMKDTVVKPGGLMRCCTETLVKNEMKDPDREVQEGEILDCMYEKPGNKRMIFKEGHWEWNRESSV